ncbi:MAG: hypothetical protein JNM31_08740 [Flavobacteriales bacterium]|nr:hypothetical protein [Flavobacteriales bacterium]
MEATRIAPTPSGFLHAGNALNFLLAARLARHHQARMRLRIDDLDAARMRPAYVQDIFDSLQWLGIRWDEGPQDAATFHTSGSQRLRIGRYEEMLARLVNTGRVYACTCSRTQRAQAGAVHACRDAALPLNAPDAAWLLKVEPGTMVRIPALHGTDVHVDLAQVMGDPVVRQRLGTPAYQIASLTDDIDHRITFLVRGEDLLPSSACQLHIAELIGETGFLQERMVHHALMRDAKGHKLSKSEGATSLKAMRERGESPEMLNAQADALFARVLSGDR